VSSYEYRTVPMPNLASRRLRRGQSRADQVAEAFELLLNKEAIDGWDFMRTESMIVPPAPAMFGRPQGEQTVTVLVLRKVVDAVWRSSGDDHAAQQPRTDLEIGKPGKPIRPRKR